MGYLVIFLVLGLFANVQGHDIGQVVLYSEKNFQGYSHAYPFVAMGCVGYGIGFPSVLNESVSSLKTDHKIAVQPMQACMGHVSVTLEAGSYPDLPSTLKEQEPLFETVMKSFFMLPFQQDNVQLYSRPGPRGQNPVLLSTVLVADIVDSTPCFQFNDTMSIQIGGVNNHLNCLVFFTGKECQGKSFKVGPQENHVSLQVYHPSPTYYGIRMCGNDTERHGKTEDDNLKPVSVNGDGSSVPDRNPVATIDNASNGMLNTKFAFVFTVFLCQNIF